MQQQAQVAAANGQPLPTQLKQALRSIVSSSACPYSSVILVLDAGLSVGTVGSCATRAEVR